ncbi:ketosynthase chain-length factor [Streptomyces lincolnensis]|uniref:ketosynthase chain-length factor n=1 Tax=Streptomyces lincolnensis TaxID=1915 RepID=UPI001E50E808|nr:ketosynthase chain-length factor [Streptomyces lincolnensis]MCD7445168.1 ketosynthase chain-length factor [Streptomyces lincolnensis]
MSPDALVVTGMSAIAPNGVGLEEYWAATLAGTSGIGALQRFDAGSYPVRLAGEADRFVASDHVPTRLITRTDRMTHLALAAAEWALADAGVDTQRLGEYDAAVVTANSSGGYEFGQREMQALWSQGPRSVGAYQSIAWFYAASTGQISIRHKFRGPCGVIASEQAGGIDAAAQAMRTVRAGTRLAVTGGTDASLSPWGFVSQLATGRLSERPDPRRAYVPFDTEACGYVPGEGGAMLVVESAAAASARGARRIYGQLRGSATTFDPRPGSGRPPALRRAIESALADAGVRASDIDVVFADGMGVPEYDAAEAAALTDVFGRHGVPVTVPKTMTGRLYAGGAALDVVTALLSVRDGVIPPSVSITRPVPDYGLDLVIGRPVRRTVRNALVVARGYGGFNAALVVGENT